MRTARTFLDVGRYPDALAFLEKAGSLDEIEALGQKAVQMGDLFLYEACCRGRGKDPVQADLVRLAEAAEGEGKLHFARKAFRLAGLEARAEALEPRVAELLAPPAPTASGPPAAEPVADFDLDGDDE
jgi:hypothetical protein